MRDDSSEWCRYHAKNILDDVLGANVLEQGLYCFDATSPLNAALLFGESQLDSMQVDFSGSEADKSRRHVVKAVQRREAAHELAEVFRGGWCDAAIDGSMHSEERNNVHLVADNFNVDLGLLAQCSKVADFLDMLTSPR